MLVFLIELLQDGSGTRNWLLSPGDQATDLWLAHTTIETSRDQLLDGTETATSMLSERVYPIPLATH